MRSPGYPSGAGTQQRGRSFVFARGVLRAELDQISRRPFSMPSGWLVLALTAVIAIALALASGAGQSTHGLARLPAPVVYVLALLAGLAGSIGLMALAQLLEALGFRTASHAYLLRTAAGDAGAYIRGRHRLTLSSVWAWPRRTGVGARVVQQACDDVDQAQAPLWLVAGNRGLVVYYQRFGFRRVRRVMTGHLMRRPPAATGGGSVQQDPPFNGDGDGDGDGGGGGGGSGSAAAPVAVRGHRDCQQPSRALAAGVEACG